jgi:hypothetical protein
VHVLWPCGFHFNMEPREIINIGRPSLGGIRETATGVVSHNLSALRPFETDADDRLFATLHRVPG